MVMKLVAYKAGSESAKALSEGLGIKRLKDEGSAWKGKKGDVVINWGRSTDHNAFHSQATIMNSPEAVQTAVCKLKSFLAMEGKVSIPLFTQKVNEASKWLDAGGVVVCRTILNGHSGQGIVLSSKEENVALVKAPLYTEYIKKQDEFRIHVFNGEAFFAQRKARKKEVPDDQVNWKIRNLAGGFIYANQNIEVSEEVKKQAVAAIAALGLDFGAVDIITNKRGEVYVLEVNTACGLAGTTLTKYVEQFQKVMG